MFRLPILAAVLTLTVAATADAQEPKTYFDLLEGAFAVAEVEPSEAQTYREGRLLVFPGAIKDMVYARVGKPQSVLVIFEVREGETPPVRAGERFFAPMQVMPRYSYWRDNLPKLPHHQILGGSRYVFTGDQIDEVKRVTRPFTATFERKRADRWPDQGDALAEALLSDVEVLREDAVRHLERSPQVLKALRPGARDRVAEFLASDALEEMRVRLVDALAFAEAREMAPTLDRLAERDDAVGAAALRALEKLGTRRPTQALLERRKAGSDAVRAAVGELLAARAGEDAAAADAAAGLLDSDASPVVRSAIARGFGRSRASSAVEPLSRALARGGQESEAVASALASIGGPPAVASLKKAITDGTDGAGSAAIIAMTELQGPCEDCFAFLKSQYESHPDEGIRDLIGIMLEVDAKHEH